MSESTTGSTDQTTTSADVASLQEQLNAAIAERDTLKTQHRDLKAASKGTTELQKSYEELQTKYSTLTDEFGSFKTSLKQKLTDTHIQTALDASGAHNAERVKAMLNLSTLKIADDGTPDHVSLADAIGALKTSDPYMFKPEGGDVGKVETSGSTTNTTSSALPEVKRAAHDATKDAFALALAEAKKDRKDPFGAIQKVLDKYGK